MRSGNAETEWVDALVDLLEQEGHPKPARSGVVRLALLWLQEAVAGRRRAEIFKFCVNRERVADSACSAAQASGRPSARDVSLRHERAGRA